MSLNLKAFVSQRLVPTVDGKRCAAIEILLGSPTVQEMVKRGNVHEIKEIMEKSLNLGMQTFDRALYRLWDDGKVALEDALKNADSPNNLRLMIKLAGKSEVEQKPVKSKEPDNSSSESTEKEEQQKESTEASSTAVKTSSGVTLELESVTDDDEAESKGRAEYKIDTGEEKSD